MKELHQSRDECENLKVDLQRARKEVDETKKKAKAHVEAITLRNKQQLQEMAKNMKEIQRKMAEMQKNIAILEKWEEPHSLNASFSTLTNEQIK